MITFTDEEEKAAIIRQMEREAKEWEEREARRIREEVRQRWLKLLK